MLQNDSSKRKRASPSTRRSRRRSNFFFQAEDGIRDSHVTGVQTCALPISKDCKCSNVTITTSPVNFINEVSFAFDVNWTITSTGTNGTCRGEIVSHDPVRVTPAGFAFDSDVSVSKRKRTLACAGRCGRLSKGTFFITGTAKQDLKRKIRAGRKYLYKLDLFCADTAGTRTQVGTASMTVIYDTKGTVDGKASDLNGNGKPDLGKNK